MPIQCPHCHHANRDSARFCGGCGAPLPQAGPAGALVSPSGSPTVAASSQTGILLPNTLLAGRYLIMPKIDKGGMAVVYQARDVRLPGKLWAVKEMSDALITNPAEKQRAISAFLREAQILATLEHPNIPKVADSFGHTGKHYLVMEYVDGSTLEALLTTQGHPFSETEVRAWLDQLCSALAYLHARRPPVIFRDLKPENIMLDRSGQIKLIDFGIARLLQPGKAKDTAQLGTVGYAPPEQYGQGQTDARSDVYALGVTLHRLLTGYDPTVTPFNLPPICQLSPGISPTMEQVITRALEQNPRNRWQSIGAIQVVLQSGHQRQNAGAGSTIRAPLAPPSPSSRPTTRLLLAAAGFSNQQLATAVGGLVILITLGIWLLAPAIQRNLPIIWNNVPTFAIAGLTAYAAARRHGAAILAHVPITLAGWLTWWARSGYAPGSYWPLLVGTVVSGVIIEGGLYYLPQIRGKTQDDAWKREVVWFALLAIAATVSFYVFLNGPIGLAHSMRLGIWVGAAVIGVAGWFLGDLVQQWLYLRQTGIRRTMRT